MVGTKPSVVPGASRLDSFGQGKTAPVCTGMRAGLTKLVQIGTELRGRAPNLC